MQDAPANAEPLPWRPFYPEPLPAPPEEYLYDMREQLTLRAVMQIIERRTRHAVRDLCNVRGDDPNVHKYAGTLDAYLDLHGYLTRAVETLPAQKS